MNAGDTKKAMSTLGRLVKIEEAARFLKVSKYTLYGWTCHSKIPFRKIGRGLRFDLKELVAWTQSKSGKPEASGLESRVKELEGKVAALQTVIRMRSKGAVLA